jgi:hypothetical protein
MLSFEITESGRVIQIHIDRDGLSVLQKALNNLMASGHVHLRSAPNGGRELNELTPWGTPAVQEVIITTGGDNPVSQ